MTAPWTKLVFQRSVLIPVLTPYVEEMHSAKLRSTHLSVIVHLVFKETRKFHVLRLNVQLTRTVLAIRSVIILLVHPMAGENVCHFVRKALVLVVQLALLITIKRDVPAILLLQGMALQSVLTVRMILA